MVKLTWKRQRESDVHHLCSVEDDEAICAYQGFTTVQVPGDVKKCLPCLLAARAGKRELDV